MKVYIPIWPPLKTGKPWLGGIHYSLTDFECLGKAKPLKILELEVDLDFETVKGKITKNKDKSW